VISDPDSYVSDEAKKNPNAPKLGFWSGCSETLMLLAGTLASCGSWRLGANTLWEWTSEIAVCQSRFRAKTPEPTNATALIRKIFVAINFRW
jgi:hypothetical protein